jgi:hypothetical protein
MDELARPVAGNANLDLTGAQPPNNAALGFAAATTHPAAAEPVLGREAHSPPRAGNRVTLPTSHPAVGCNPLHRLSRCHHLLRFSVAGPSRDACRVQTRQDDQQGRSVEGYEIDSPAQNEGTGQHHDHLEVSNTLQ